MFLSQGRLRSKVLSMFSCLQSNTSHAEVCGSAALSWIHRYANHSLGRPGGTIRLSWVAGEGHSEKELVTWE